MIDNVATFKSTGRVTQLRHHATASDINTSDAHAQRPRHVGNGRCLDTALPKRLPGNWCHRAAHLLRCPAEYFATMFQNKQLDSLRICRRIVVEQPPNTTITGPQSLVLGPSQKVD